MCLNLVFYDEASGSEINHLHIEKEPADFCSQSSGGKWWQMRDSDIGEGHTHESCHDAVHDQRQNSHNPTSHARVDLVVPAANSRTLVHRRFVGFHLAFPQSLSLSVPTLNICRGFGVKEKFQKIDKCSQQDCKLCVGKFT